jgi:hypothetical protein
MATDSPKITAKATMTDFLAIMFHSANQSKLWHLQTKSYAQHIALEQYYDGISEFLDDFIEKHMSDGPKVKAPQSVKLESLTGTAQISEHLDMILEYLDKIRTELFRRTELVNMIDDAKALIHKTQSI